MVVVGMVVEVAVAVFGKLFVFAIAVGAKSINVFRLL